MRGALIMACDFRFAAEGAELGLLETNIGYFFTWGCSPRLTRLVGASKAKEWIMTCDRIDAARGANGPVSVRLTKKLVNAYALRGMADLFVAEPELATHITLAGEPRERVAAFLEGRAKARSR